MANVLAPPPITDQPRSSASKFVTRNRLSRVHYGSMAVLLVGIFFTCQFAMATQWPGTFASQHYMSIRNNIGPLCIAACVAGAMVAAVHHPSSFIGGLAARRAGWSGYAPWCSVLSIVTFLGIVLAGVCSILSSGMPKELLAPLNTIAAVADTVVTVSFVWIGAGIASLAGRIAGILVAFVSSSVAVFTPSYVVSLSAYPPVWDAGLPSEGEVIPMGTSAARLLLWVTTAIVLVALSVLHRRHVPKLATPVNGAAASAFVMASVTAFSVGAPSPAQTAPWVGGETYCEDRENVTICDLVVRRDINDITVSGAMRAVQAIGDSNERYLFILDDVAQHPEIAAQVATFPEANVLSMGGAVHSEDYSTLFNAQQAMMGLFGFNVCRDMDTEGGPRNDFRRVEDNYAVVRAAHWAAALSVGQKPYDEPPTFHGSTVQDFHAFFLASKGGLRNCTATVEGL